MFMGHYFSFVFVWGQSLCEVIMFKSWIHHHERFLYGLSFIILGTSCGTTLTKYIDNI
jgi:hypothetical protein